MFKKYCFFVLALLPLSVVNAATLNIVGGDLIGASNVDVGGSLYDVEFMDGTCIAVFDNCDSTSDFVFQTASSAGQASASLLSQVLIDGVLGQFDTSPQFTLGCTDLSTCRVVTPYAFTSSMNPLVAFLVNNSASGDAVFGGSGGFSLNPDQDLVLLTNFTYANWSPVSAVPVPAAIWLFGTALLGLTGFRQRKGPSTPN